MVVLLYILAGLALAGGLFALVAGQGGTAEALALFSIGFAIPTGGLAAILQQLTGIRKLAHRQAASLERIQMNLARSPDDASATVSPPRRRHVLDDLGISPAAAPRTGWWRESKRPERQLEPAAGSVQPANDG
jgi:hypothetical protein